MFKLPDWPHVLVVRHLECISCKHMLEISEAEIDNRGRARHLVPRYRQHPNQTAVRENQPGADSARTVDCPRCGADNRNWLYLSLRPYVKRIPFAGRLFVVLITFTFILAGPALLMMRYTEKNEPNARNIFLIIAALLALTLPVLVLSPRWRELRDHTYLQKAAGLSWRRRISPLWISGLSLVFTLAVVLPAGRYLVFPIAQNKLESFIAPEPRLEGSARVTDILDTINSHADADIDAAALAMSVDNLQRIMATQRFCQNTNWNVVRARLEEVEQTATDRADAAVIADAVKNLELAFAGRACRPEYLQVASGILHSYGEQLSANTAYAQCAAINDYTKKNLCLLSEQLSTTESATQKELSEALGLWGWQELNAKSKDDILLETREVLVELRQFLAASNSLPVQAQIDTELDNIKRLFESQVLQNELKANAEFVAKWAKLVGLAGIISIIVSVALARHDEQLYDPNLPRPVFHSVAAMAPTVIWELNETVGMPVNANRIQWMNIERNARGGVTLTGLYRSALSSGDNAPGRVRGQEFVVETDPWCYIQNTSITDVLAAPPLTDDKPPAPTENNVSALPAFSVNNGRIQST